MSNNEPTAAGAPAVVEIWSDIACPWCYIGKRRFARALEQFEGRDRVQVVWRSFQLAPDTPAGLGRNELEALVEHKGMAPDQVRAMFAHVSSTAAADGLDMDFDTVIAANTFDAHRLVHLAGDRADEVVDALFRAHFTQGRIIDDRDELVAVAAEVGLDAGEIRAALDGDAAAEQVHADLAQARALGVTGVPFFVANRALAVSGAQPVGVFTQLLDRALATAGTITADEAAPSCEDGSCAV
ncbi:DsbA family oxidoreductase [Speluncibacter jeojiensis]|uniref:DsbA family oxidoreductase n=1 Tax=Speluncibacter jeojiensis TaxID=2710754 RepID=A0A9X4M7X3_9ACTN|nr:DsbA family oxidoreductase [Rhodococcus sp. D2-41]MDG3016923.1 DsbA family oxidoreductase [Corynebacteriales bacterium D3-21]